MVIVSLAPLKKFPASAAIREAWRGVNSGGMIAYHPFPAQPEGPAAKTGDFSSRAGVPFGRGQQRAVAKSALAHEEFGKAKFSHDGFEDERPGEGNVGLRGFKTLELPACACWKTPELRNFFANLLQTNAQGFAALR